MPKACELCRNVCCNQIFDDHDTVIPYPTQDQIEANTAVFLEENPEFYITDKEPVESTPETLIPIFGCRRYNRQTKKCGDYEHRFRTCRDAGETYAPYPDCALWLEAHPRPPSKVKQFFSSIINRHGHNVS